jgi:hypothetical protein
MFTAFIEKHFGVIAGALAVAGLVVGFVYNLATR